MSFSLNLPQRFFYIESLEPFSQQTFTKTDLSFSKIKSKGTALPRKQLFQSLNPRIGIKLARFQGNCSTRTKFSSMYVGQGDQIGRIFELLGKFSNYWANFRLIWRSFTLGIFWKLQKYITLIFDYFFGKSYTIHLT
jgi:hypothetical protein